MKSCIGQNFVNTMQFNEDLHGCGCNEVPMKREKNPPNPFLNSLFWCVSSVSGLYQRMKIEVKISGGHDQHE